MGIITKTITEARCDLCKEEIDTNLEFIDAGVYGAAFHSSCLRQYDPLIRALGIDDIRMHHGGDKYRPSPTRTHKTDSA